MFSNFTNLFGQYQPLIVDYLTEDGSSAQKVCVDFSYIGYIALVVIVTFCIMQIIRKVIKND